MASLILSNTENTFTYNKNYIKINLHRSPFHLKLCDLFLKDINPANYVDFSFNRYQVFSNIYFVTSAVNQVWNHPRAIDLLSDGRP